MKKPFEKIVNVSVKGLFSAKVPERNISQNIIQLTEVYASTLLQLEEEFNAHIRLFEALDAEYSRVILYKVSEETDSGDGSGVGFVFNWAVFRKIELPELMVSERYFFERGAECSKEISRYYHNIKEWKEISWSEEKEAFFLRMSLALRNIYLSVKSFVEDCDFKNLQKLLPFEEEVQHDPVHNDLPLH